MATGCTSTQDKALLIPSSQDLVQSGVDLHSSINKKYLAQKSYTYDYQLLRLLTARYREIGVIIWRILKDLISTSGRITTSVLFFNSYGFL